MSVKSPPLDISNPRYYFPFMDETKILREELEHYKNEKERVRKILGQVGGKSSKKKDTAVNILFLILVIGLFAFDIIREVFDLSFFGITRFISIEIAILLISIKIIWMINRQQKVDHFQFWILNSIEFQINLISKRIRELENTLKAAKNGKQEGT
ncbi:MAG: hypothetical protein JXQ30_08080 [Spirochaetes bacterium]|nr:hypothetical protein [Spirochaetota bacterium]